MYIKTKFMDAEAKYFLSALYKKYKKDVLGYIFVRQTNFNEKNIQLFSASFPLCKWFFPTKSIMERFLFLYCHKRLVTIIG